LENGRGKKVMSENNGNREKLIKQLSHELKEKYSKNAEIIARNLAEAVENTKDEIAKRIIDATKKYPPVEALEIASDFNYFRKYMDGEILGLFASVIEECSSSPYIGASIAFYLKLVARTNKRVAKRAIKLVGNYTSWPYVSEKIATAVGLTAWRHIRDKVKATEAVEDLINKIEYSTLPEEAKEIAEKAIRGYKEF
jgi:TRAP-type mannitol/chloroaromatic compound transport system substrate-binding protein